MMMDACFMNTIIMADAPDCIDQSTVAVACSGGPDSMALTKLVSDWSVLKGGIAVHALIVDHGLRLSSAEEAKITHEHLKNLPNVMPFTLVWDGPKPDTKIQEYARTKRYEMMATHCLNHNIKYLFLGHHQNDQAETVLFRLAKGSGLSGLGGMRSVQPYDDNLLILRPLINVPKEQILSFCKTHDISYVQDPSNTQDRYARVRLRGAWDILSAEGLTANRLAVTARRLERADRALDTIADYAFQDAIIVSTKDLITLSLDVILNNTDEIALRVILKSIHALRMDQSYAPRMEKVEALFYDLITSMPFRKRTLGG